MSTLSTLSRKCTVSKTLNVLNGTISPCVRRRYATPAGKNRNTSGPVERDAKGMIIRKQKEKPLGAFRPLPAAQLTHPLLKSESPSSLDLLPFQPKNITSNMVGHATEFVFTDKDPVQKFGLPKKMLLEFRILSKPCSVIRQVTVDTLNLLKEASSESSLDSRFVLSGRPGCGKSFLLLQAVEWCAANNWVVIYIPRAVTLVNSTTPYVYDLRTQTYLQPTFAFQTLQRMLSVNSTLLASLHTSQKLLFEKREVPLGTALTDVINIALKEHALAPVILDSVMKELSVQTKHPVLLAVDDFQSLYCKTAYKDPHFASIRPYHLSMPRLILEFASGKRSFAKGAVVGSITSSDPNYTTPLELREALSLPNPHPSSPYDKRSRSLIEYTDGLRALPVPEQLSVAEAASLFEVWMKDKALVPRAYDELFLAKYTESSGNARDFVWKGLLATLEN